MKYTIQGQKGILIQLDKYPEEMTTTESGIIIPQYRNYESDGGRPAVALEKEVFTTTGTILQISAKSEEELADQKIDVKVGDKVYIQPAAKTHHNWFFPDRNIRVQDFTGLLLVTASSIQAKIDDEA